MRISFNVLFVLSDEMWNAEHYSARDASYRKAYLRQKRFVYCPQSWRHRFHALGINDGLTRKGPFSIWMDNWQKFLAASDPEQDEEIGLHTRTGQPLGSESFIRRAERVAGRSPRPRGPGPKPTLTKDSKQGDLDIG